MRDYGIVSPKFWIGATGKQLRGDPVAQVVAAYLMTSPHSTMTGVFHCPVLYISEETGTPMKGASKALRRLIDEGFCEYDTVLDAVFVVRMAAFQIGESLKPSDTRVVGLKRDVEKMASRLLKQRFLEIYGRVYHLVPEDWKPDDKVRGINGASPPHRCQDQDQDQDQKQDQEKEGVAKPTPPLGLDLIVWERWVGYRKQIKKPIKAPSIEAAMLELAKYGEAQAAVVQQSIAHSWQGLFELKATNGSGASRPPSRKPKTLAELEAEEVTRNAQH